MPDSRSEIRPLQIATVCCRRQDAYHIEAVLAATNLMIEGSLSAIQFAERE